MRAIFLVLTLGLFLALAASTAAKERSQRVSCPPTPSQVTFQPVGVVLAAAQKLLAQQTTQVQGRTYRLTPKWAPIDFLANLATVGNGSPLDRMAPGLLAVHKLAVSECGFRVAQSTWAVRYHPPTLIAGLSVYAFFTKTPSGWQFWGNWCGAGQTRAWRKTNCY